MLDDQATSSSPHDTLPMSRPRVVSALSDTNNMHLKWARFSNRFIYKHSTGHRS
jgi:hypothetical protein